MKIVQLDIQGFRSLKNVSWRPGDLNVVIGPNGSGKSNVLRMLELISASAQGKLEAFIGSAGGANQLTWDGELPGKIIFSLKFLAGFAISDDPLTYQVEAMDGSFTRAFDYKIVEEVLSTKDGFNLIEYTEDTQGGFVLQRKGKLSERQGASVEVPGPNTETIFSSVHMLLSVLVGFVLSMTPFYREQLIKWSIYQDIRMDQHAPIRQAPVSRLEQMVSPDGQNLINVLHTLYTSDRKFKQDINDAMFAAFGDDFDELIFPPAADQRIQMRVRWKTLKREQSAADLSDGTLRFLFLLTVLASPNPPPLIAIDEPETGLHPSMLPIITEYAVEAATRTQVIFTTHSDQFLSAFRETRPTVTVAKWENGETTLTTLDDSELDYWLRDYSLGKLFRSGELENMAT